MLWIRIHFERVQVSARKFSHCVHRSNSQCCMMSDGARICCSWSFSVDARSWPVCTVTTSNWSLSKSIETQHCYEAEHCYEVQIAIGEANMVLGRQCLRATCVVSISHSLFLHAVYSSLIFMTSWCPQATVWLAIQSRLRQWLFEQLWFCNCALWYIALEKVGFAICRAPLRTATRLILKSIYTDLAWSKTDNYCHIYIYYIYIIIYFVSLAE